MRQRWQKLILCCTIPGSAACTKEWISNELTQDRKKIQSLYETGTSGDESRKVPAVTADANTYAREHSFFFMLKQSCWYLTY